MAALELKTLKVSAKLHHALKRAALEDDVPLGALVLYLLLQGLEIRKAEAGVLSSGDPEPGCAMEVPT